MAFLSFMSRVRKSAFTVRSLSRSFCRLSNGYSSNSHAHSITKMTAIGTITRGRGHILETKRLFSLSALSTLPEYKAAADFDRKGNFSRAVPLYQRTHEVISSSMGPDSPLSVHVAFRLVKSFIHAAQYKEAKKVLSVYPFLGNTSIDILDMGKNIESSILVKAQHLITIISLMEGDIKKAVAAAERGTELCEAQDSRENDISLYPASYGLKGLLYLLLSEIDEAEQYLQMAARWSQTSKDSMIALNNLGVMCWFQLGLSLTQNQGNIEEKCFLTRDLLHFCSSIRKSVNDNDEMKNDFQKSIKLTEEQHILLQDAISYWEDAIEEATSDRGCSDNAQQVAAALCGANLPVGDMSIPTPSSIPKNPIGMEVRGVPTSKPRAKEDKRKNGEEILTVRLKDVVFAMNYANLLCNLAIGRTLLAGHQYEEIASVDRMSEDKKSQKNEAIVMKTTLEQYKRQESEQINISVELLTSAVKAVEVHLGSASQSQEEVASKTATTDLIIAPVLGRALGQLGVLYTHPYRGSPPEPVFAEGLYRAALDKLDGPYAIRDNRFLYERAVITRDYGVLLGKWDKREDSGICMQNDSEMIFDMLPRFEKSLVLNAMILFPVEL